MIGVVKSLLAASVLSLAAAAPYNEVKPGSFKVVQQRNPHYDNSTFVPRGALAMYKAYMKYGAPVPDAINKTVTEYRAAKQARLLAKRARSGSVTTTPVNDDEEYITPVSIGTPAQQLNLDFDTGSSDLWVYSTLLPAADDKGQTEWAPGKSSTAKRLTGATWKISYGVSFITGTERNRFCNFLSTQDGSSSSGIVYTDTVTIGGVTYASQAVEAAEKVSSEFVSDTDSDGLLGLAFSNLNSVTPTAQKTFFDNIKSTLTQPLFVANLKHDEAGTYEFGAIDTSAYTGEIAYTAVSTSPGYWTFDAAGYSIGSAASSGAAIQGIADTGTTLLYLPTAIVKKYYAQVTSAKYSELEGGYTLSCNGSPPDFNIFIGTTKITVPGSYIAYAPLTTGGTTCFGGLQPNTGIGLNIFGDIALKAAYVVFEDSGTSPRLGWANKNLS
ncbi:hypothetical protein PFICI_12897 [Pestalotiopsis fici W106-1]|uniref:Peptidase A1 domain-containing protein n=1 Tax=Pestalotiopsis fici (strain W106-1 / CGMCC3.15140) TaxID=1229662 RepID=W3WQ12_PESFW|nr:uncharacterized protein PFICI_12897 [Pestalotiopsis fici W106-1]ETS75953.1 hypothetical protein PFICI_12897 [Pestalotiopsis fici W106-1]